MIAPWRVTLLGGLRLERDGQTIARFRSQKTGALLAFLCLQPGRMWGREELCEQFWPADEFDVNAAPDAGRNSLRVALASLRKVLEAAPCPAGAVLETTATHVRLRPEAIRTDVAAFEAACKAGQAARARQLYTGPFLPGCYDDWAVQEADRLAALLDGLGAETAPVGPSLPPSFLRHAGDMVSSAPDNLPVPLGRFFGRDEETAQLEMLLLDPTARLVTIVGAGGTGKTRFVVETARLLLREKPRQAARFPGGIWFVPLAPVRDAARIPAILQATLELPIVPGEDPLAQIEAHLAARPALILLDNLEQVGVADLTALLSDLIQRLPQVMWLATSRRRVGLRGERVLRLTPLSLPDPEDSLEEMASNPALGLFVDRAREADVDFALTARNAPDVASVCMLLDGVPLAIELAAAWTNVFSPRQMEQSLRAKAGTFAARTEAEREERHRSLYHAARWSYDLLPSAVRALFARLSVFSGGFTLDAATIVCDVPDTPDALARLVEQSLVVPSPESRNDEGRRFTILEPLREFASEQLADDDKTVFLKRHAEWIIACTDARAQTGNWASVEPDINNVRAALRRALAAPEDEAAATEQAMRVAVCAWQFWWSRGLWEEGTSALEAALQRDTPDVPAIVRIGAWRARGAFDFYRNRYAEASASWEKQLSIALEAGETLLAARARVNLAMIASAGNRFDAARQQCADAIALYESIGADTASRAAAYCNLGTNCFLMDDLPAALAAFQHALALFRSLGEAGWQGLVPTLTGIGVIHEYNGAYDVAYVHFHEAIGISRKEGTTMRLADSLLHLVTVCAQLGTPDARREGEACLREAIPLRRALNNNEGIGRTLEAAAMLFQEYGDPCDAARIWGAYDALYRDNPAMQQTPQQERRRDTHGKQLCTLTGETTFNTCHQDGNRWSAERALDFIEQTLPQPAKS